MERSRNSGKRSKCGLGSEQQRVGEVRAQKIKKPTSLGKDKDLSLLGPTVLGVR